MSLALSSQIFVCASKRHNLPSQMECSQIKISFINQGKEPTENIWQGGGAKPTLKMSEWTSVRHIERRANQISLFQLGDSTLTQCGSLCLGWIWSANFRGICTLCTFSQYWCWKTVFSCALVTSNAMLTKDAWRKSKLLFCFSFIGSSSSRKDLLLRTFFLSNGRKWFRLAYFKAETQYFILKVKSMQL